MRICTLVASVSRQAGGLFFSVRGLCQSLRAAGADVDVLSTMDQYTAHDLSTWTPIRPQAFRCFGPRMLGYTPQLPVYLCAGGYDIVMTHGLWMYPSAVALHWYRRWRKPHIVNPHGMLDPWAVARSRWKKRVAAALYERENLQTAGCIRALCDAEADAIRAFGLRNPVCIIPNGVELPERSPGTVSPPPWAGRIDAGRRVLLFLGRIHPKKGLASLLRAWADLGAGPGSVRREWALVIAGPDESQHQAALEAAATEFGVRDSVLFAGPYFGSAKDAAYRHASAVVLASLSEGLPVAIQEAWAYALPVLVTPQCNVPEGVAAGAAIEVTADPRGLRGGLIELLSLRERDLAAMGERGRQIAESRYAWATVGRQTLEVCTWLQGGGPPPSTVRLA